MAPHPASSDGNMGRLQAVNLGDPAAGVELSRADAAGQLDASDRGRARLRRRSRAVAQGVRRQERRAALARRDRRHSRLEPGQLRRGRPAVRRRGGRPDQQCGPRLVAHLPRFRRKQRREARRAAEGRRRDLGLRAAALGLAREGERSAAPSSSTASGLTWPKSCMNDRDRPGPAGLVAGADAGAVVAVEVLVEQQVVAPVRDRSGTSRSPPKTGRRPSLVAQEDARPAGSAISARTSNRSSAGPSRSGTRP